MAESARRGYATLEGSGTLPHGVGPAAHDWHLDPQRESASSERDGQRGQDALSSESADHLHRAEDCLDLFSYDPEVLQRWQECAGPYVFDEEEGGLAWQADALCAQTDPEAFFPEKGGSTRDAKRVCAECPVSTACLEYALAKDERFGIWGGLSERERRRLRRRTS